MVRGTVGMSESNVLQIVFSSKIARAASIAPPSAAAAQSEDRERLLAYVKERGLGGLLLHSGTRYVGVIEGPDDVVLLFMEQESTSGAVQDLHVLRERKIPTRRFRELSQFILPQQRSAEPLDETGARFVSRLTAELEVFDAPKTGSVGDGGR